MNAVTKAERDAASTGIKPAAEAAGAAPNLVRGRGGRPAAGGSRRIMLMALVPVAMLAGGVIYWVGSGRYEETENASFRQAHIAIAAEVSGRVIASRVRDNETVRAGQELFRIDPETYRIALAQADAALAQARLNVEQLRAAYKQALAQQKAAQDEADYLDVELKRQIGLAQKGVTTETATQDARHDLTKAQDQLLSARQAVESARAAIAGDPELPTDKHPNVMAALAAREKAAYNLGLTTVSAPADGIVYQASSFKPGQFVAAGATQFTLVETGDNWIEANFKESQLTHIKAGQSAEVTIDTYPGRKLEARVTAIGAGTGAEFSLLPAQNATGNWVKVTQRIPVWLKLEEGANDLTLRTGMSASVSVDTNFRRKLGDLLPF